MRLRAIVANLSSEALGQVEGVTIIGPSGDGIEIETDRYRSFTGVVERLAIAGAEIREIAGNDEILFTALSDDATVDGALGSFQRQGYGDFRHLILVDVRDLADRLRALDGMVLEHVHDY